LKRRCFTCQCPAHALEKPRGSRAPS
jgi:hypothetical protein